MWVSWCLLWSTLRRDALDSSDSCLQALIIIRLLLGSKPSIPRLPNHQPKPPCRHKLIEHAYGMCQHLTITWFGEVPVILVWNPGCQRKLTHNLFLPKNKVPPQSPCLWQTIPYEICLFFACWDTAPKKRDFPRTWMMWTARQGCGLQPPWPTVSRSWSWRFTSLWRRSWDDYCGI